MSSAKVERRCMFESILVGVELIACHIKNQRQEVVYFTSQALFLNRFFFSESGKISQSGEQFFKTTSGVNYRPNREISPHIKSDLLIRRKCTLLGPIQIKLM